MSRSAVARDYAEEPSLLPRVIALLGTVFGFVPEQIAAAEPIGLRWAEVSRPFVVTEGGTDGPVLAHVGVLALPLVVDGERIDAAGVHAVATHPDHRGRGLYRRCMEAALAHVDATYDVTLLSTGLPAIYAPFGFRHVTEHRFLGRMPRVRRTPDVRPLDYADAADVRRLRDLLARREPVSDRFGLRGEEAVFLFNQARTPPLYSPSLEALLVTQLEGETLRLFDVVAPRMPTLAEVVARLPQEGGNVEVHFEPSKLEAELEPEPFVLDGDDHLCVRGALACEARPFFWPCPARC